MTERAAPNIDDGGTAPGLSPCGPKVARIVARTPSPVKAAARRGQLVQVGRVMTERPNRRRYPRYEVDGLVGRLERRLSGRVLDVSLGGIAIETDAPLTLGHSYSLSLAREDRSARLHGTARWSRLVRTDGEGAVYRSGLQFEEVLGPRAEQLLPILEEGAAEPTLRDRLFGRLAPLEGTELEIGSEHDFRVLKLSLAGMLLESDFLPRLNSELEIELPVNQRAVRTDVRVVTAQPLHQPSAALWVELGVEFLGLDEAATEHLSRYLSGLAD